MIHSWNVVIFFGGKRENGMEREYAFTAISKALHEGWEWLFFYNASP
jgi:hypothetical protein